MPAGVGEPGRIPERPDLAGGLIARAGASIEVIVGGRIQEKRLHHIHAQVTPRQPVRLVSETIFTQSWQGKIAQIVLWTKGFCGRYGNGNAIGARPSLADVAARG